MKKSFVLFLSIFTLPTFASGINSTASSAPCTNNTLETYSGNSNLSADWQPNEIQLRWYNGNTLMNVQNTANTCVYDSTLTIPSTAPTRTGYTFAGWTVRPEMDFSTIPTNVIGTERWMIGTQNNHDLCWYDTNTGAAYTVSCNTYDSYKELQQQEWKVKFSHGYLYGMAGCSETNGTYAQPGNPTIGSGGYCWCKATGYKATNSNIIRGPSAKLPWVFRTNLNNYINCIYTCTTYCAYRIYNDSVLLNALFTPAQ